MIVLCVESSRRDGCRSSRTKGETYYYRRGRRICHGDVGRVGSGDAIDYFRVGIWVFRARDLLWSRLSGHVCGVEW